MWGSVPGYVGQPFEPSPSSHAEPGEWCDRPVSVLLSAATLLKRRWHMGKWFSSIGVRMRSESGAALVEWGLLVILIAVVALLAVTLAGQEVSSQYSIIVDELQSA